MLLIRSEQYAHFAARELQDYRRQLTEHLLATFPLQTALVDEAAIGDFVELAITQARDVGLETQASVQSFADHMVLLGVDFHVNPLYAAIAEALFDPDLISPIQRMDLVHERAWAYLEVTRGPQATALIHALGRLRVWLSMPNERWGLATADSIARLALLFPEKCRAHDERTLDEFCTAALARAAADGFTQPPAQALYVSLAFLAGLGFFHDPLILGGAQEYLRALADAADPAHRTGLFGRGTAAYLDKILDQVRIGPPVAAE